MAHNRAQLNALIFHNPVVLPPTSPGYAEMTIAVAELQGGNCAKAAFYAEAAVTKDPMLAAGWLAKTAADVFEATPGDLRQERALFCMDRALERAPSCRREIIEFFVSNILGHYVEVLCAGSQEELTQWFQVEAHAGELEDNARMLNWEANQLHGEAALLQATGLVTGSVALFSRRMGTQVFAGVASVAAFSEAARRTNNAAFLEGMAAELPRVGYTLRLEGNEHRTASMGYLVPARDLIGVAARLLQAEGLPPQSLDRLIHAFTFSFRQVLANHLLQLNRQLNEPMFYAIGGDANSLAATYHTHPGPIATRGARDAYAGPHPASRDTLLWLEHMVPGVRRLEAYQLLSNPMPTISERVYGFYRPRLGASLPKRMDDAYKMHTAGPMGCLAVATLACVFLLPPLGIVLGVLSIICAFQSLTRRRSRTRLQSLVDSLWSVDTWLGMPGDTVLSQSGTLTGNWHQGPPLLTVGAQVGKSASRTAPSTSTIILRVCVSLVILFFALVLLGVLVGPTHPDTSPGKTSDDPAAAVAMKDTGVAKPPPQVRLAIPVRSAAAPIPSPAASLSASNLEETYSVVGVSDGDALNVRAGPGVNKSVIARLANGTTNIRVTGTPVMNGPTQWVPIRVGDQTGWVTKQHLQRE